MYNTLYTNSPGGQRASKHWQSSTAGGLSGNIKSVCRLFPKQVYTEFLKWKTDTSVISDSVELETTLDPTTGIYKTTTTAIFTGKLTPGTSDASYTAGGFTKVVYDVYLLLWWYTENVTLQAGPKCLRNGNYYDVYTNTGGNTCLQGDVYLYDNAADLESDTPAATYNNVNIYYKLSPTLNCDLGQIRDTSNLLDGDYINVVRTNTSEPYGRRVDRMKILKDDPTAIINKRFYYGPTQGGASEIPGYLKYKDGERASVFVYKGAAYINTTHDGTMHNAIIGTVYGNGAENADGTGQNISIGPEKDFIILSQFT